MFHRISVSSNRPLSITRPHNFSFWRFIVRRSRLFFLMFNSSDVIVRYAVQEIHSGSRCEGFSCSLNRTRLQSTILNHASLWEKYLRVEVVPKAEKRLNFRWTFILRPSIICEKNFFNVITLKKYTIYYIIINTFTGITVVCSDNVLEKSPHGSNKRIFTITQNKIYSSGLRLLSRYVRNRITK